MSDVLKNGVTVEDIARAWASIDDRRDEFDRGKVDKEYEDKAGHYDGYMIETEELLKRAAKYANERSKNDGS